MKHNTREQAGIAIGAVVGFTVGALVIGFNFPWLAVWIAVSLYLAAALSIYY